MKMVMVMIAMPQEIASLQNMSTMDMLNNQLHGDDCHEDDDLCRLSTMDMLENQLQADDDDGHNENDDDDSGNWHPA